MIDIGHENCAGVQGAEGGQTHYLCLAHSQFLFAQSQCLVSKTGVILLVARDNVL